MSTDFSNTKVGIVISLFNEEVTTLLLEGTINRLQELGFKNENVTIIKVPGAIEIPLTAKLLAQSKQYKAIICLGCVIRGETDHFDYVCQQVSQGCQKVMLKFNLPVIFGVLTTHTIHQALERVGGYHGHKGRDAAEAAACMIEVTENLIATLGSI